jgi:hypothetical protein
MFYKLLINYIRLKLFRLILNRLMASKAVRGRNIKSMSLLAYILELGATYLLDSKKKSKRAPRPHK